MVQFDKPIHPVVLYEYDLICIFMEIHENFEKMTENNVKTIAQGRVWGPIYPALLGPFKFILNCLVGPSECETKFWS